MGLVVYDGLSCIDKDIDIDAFDQSSVKSNMGIDIDIDIDIEYV